MALCSACYVRLPASGSRPKLARSCLPAAVQLCSYDHRAACAQLSECTLTNIFVGNLSYRTTEEELQSAFSNFGAVDRVSIVRDRETGQSRGFAFVEMPNAQEAEQAINGMNGRDFGGRAINVNEARPREERGGGGGGNRFGGGGGNRGGNGGGREGGFKRREPRW